MDIPVSPESEDIARAALHGAINALLSDRRLRHDLRLQNMLLACRLRLRSLQNAVSALRQEDDLDRKSVV